MPFQKITIPTPRKVTGNSEGEVSKANIFKGKYEAKLEIYKFRGGGGGGGGAWIFSGTTLAATQTMQKETNKMDQNLPITTCGCDHLNQLIEVDLFPETSAKDY